jgi:hypothetical protein
MDTLTYHLTPEQVAAKQQKLAATGVTLPLPSGTITHDTILGEVEIDYAYDAAAQVMKIDVPRYPKVAEGKIKSTLDKWFAEES